MSIKIIFGVVAFIIVLHFYNPSEASSCKLVSPQIIKILEDPEVLTKPYKSYSIYKASAVNSYEHPRIKYMIGLKLTSQEQRDLFAVVGATKIGSLGLLFSADSLTSEIFNIGDGAQTQAKLSPKSHGYSGAIKCVQ